MDMRMASLGMLPYNTHPLVSYWWCYELVSLLTVIAFFNRTVLYNSATP